MSIRINYANELNHKQCLPRLSVSVESAHACCATAVVVHTCAPLSKSHQSDDCDVSLTKIAILVHTCVLLSKSHQSDDCDVSLIKIALMMSIILLLAGSSARDNRAQM